MTNHKPCTKTPPKPKKRLLRFLPLIAVVLTIFAVYFFVDFTVVSDWFRSLSFQPTTTVEQIMSDLKLTDGAELIFKASHPTIENNPAFTEYCGDDHGNISILGCYASDKIYIKNITDPDLAGISESTAAHELLHAVWVRLDSPTRADLGRELDAVYREHHSELSDRLADYAESTWHEELHSILGTEYINLPHALTTHYSEVFLDRAKVVAFFEAYNSKFQTLLAESETLRAQIKDYRIEISAGTENYEDGVEELNLAIEDFRRRAENGSFSNNISAFYREQAELQRRSSALSALYDQINQKISEANALIERYNANAAALSDLSDAISSPPAPPAV